MIHSRALRIGAVGLLFTAAVLSLRWYVGRAGASVPPADETRSAADSTRGESSQDRSRATRLRELRDRVGAALRHAASAAKAAQGEAKAAHGEAPEPAPPRPEVNRTIAAEFHALSPDEAEKIKAQVELTLSGRRPQRAEHDAAEMKAMIEGIRAERDPQVRFARFESYIQAATELSEDRQLTAFGDLVEMLGAARADASEDIQ